MPPVGPTQPRPRHCTPLQASRAGYHRVMTTPNPPAGTSSTASSPRTSIRRIGVLTGGGDCPGLNAVIRAVTKDAISHGVSVIGIEDGFAGLLERRTRPLSTDDVSGILTTGGTILGSSNKADPAAHVIGRDAEGKPIHENRIADCVAYVKELGIDALVVIGGDGTMTVARQFVEAGVPCVGVPKTIDNDLYGTDLTFGFQTAVGIATEAIDRVHTTAARHHRVMVVEVMGRNAGWLALHAGVASGSDVILIPEMPFTVDKVCDAITRRLAAGRKYSVICCSEGAAPLGGEQIVDRVDDTSPDPIRLGGVGKWVADRVQDKLGIDSRHVVLGHVQRGGTPAATDRVLATLFGDHAIEMLKAGITNRLVVMQQGRVTDAPLSEAAGKQRLVPADHPLVAAARSVNTSFGVL